MKEMEGCSRSFGDRLNENLQNEKKYRLFIAIDYVDFLSMLCLFTSPCLCTFPRHDVRLYVFRYFDNCMLIYFIWLGFADS